MTFLNSLTPFIKDPVVLICSGTILIGIFALIWAIAKFRRLGQDQSTSESGGDDFLPTAPDLRGLDFGTPPVFSPRVVQTSPAAPPTAVSKEVAERLDSMTHRLAEMQSLLTKQAGTEASEATGPGGAVGQGFSPETIDKLLKIIGNVVQQVDILQKNLNTSGEGASGSKETPSATTVKL